MVTRSRFAILIAAVAVPAAFLGAAACRSGSRRSATQVTLPDIRISQLGGQAAVARYESGPLPVNFRVAIRNNADDELTLKRISVESIGEGAYTLSSYTQGFNDKKIGPRETEIVQFWAPAYSERTILGANGPVTIRGIAYFGSPAGGFQRVFIQQVHDLNSGQTGN